MIRNINRFNYEEFFLDYLEGELNDSDLKDLESFLILNPDLKEELDEMCLVELEEGNDTIDKSFLKQIPFENNIDEFCIAKLEGDLKNEEDVAFTQFLNQNLISKAQFLLYEKTKLKLELDIICPDKESFKKKERKLIPYWMLSGVGLAASVALLFLLWNTSVSDKRTKQISENKVVIEKPVSEIALKPVNIKNHKQEVVSTEDVAKVATNLIDASLTKENNTKKTTPTLRGTENNANRDIPDIIKTENTLNESTKISLPELVKTSKIELVANTEIAEHILDNPQHQEELNKAIVNNGLAKLGMSWKSSVSDQKKSNSLLYAVAKMGVDKLGEIAGKKIQIEKKYDSETEKTHVNFNSKGLGFSTSIK